MNSPVEISPWRAPEGAAARIGATVCSFLDLASTSMGRATHYNSASAQAQAESLGHAALLELDRGLYTALLLHPGVTDRARVEGVRRLLATPRESHEGELALSRFGIDARVERELLGLLVAELPAARRLRLLASFAAAKPELGHTRINNARARKLALRTVLAAPQLELWAVKYRSKLAAILTHAWGKRRATYLREALSTPLGERSTEQQRALHRNIGTFAGGRARVARECVGFVLGAALAPTLPLLVAHTQAKHDLRAGTRLPLEVLEGLRSTYHPQVGRAELLELAKGSLTKTQRRQVQRKAKELGVKVQMDPLAHPPIELYIHAFAVGMSDDIAAALDRKAELAAHSFPIRYERIAVLVDASASMAGHTSQPLRPMAVALALRDMLVATASHATLRYCGGEFRTQDHAQLSAPQSFAGLCRPRGHTALAEGLLELIAHDEEALPEAIFLISDGYENARAGRLGEVLRALRAMGIELPIYHLNPVFAAELAGTGEGVRSLSDQLLTLPVARPEALGLSFLRALTQAEPERGINSLLRVVLPRLRPMLGAPTPEAEA